jgi:hypothetical protein
VKLLVCLPPYSVLGTVLYANFDTHLIDPNKCFLILNSEMCIALCKLETMFAVEFLEEGWAPSYLMIIAKVLDSMLEYISVDIKLKISDDRRSLQTMGLMITSNVKDNLTSMAV